jgi:23S rRNA (adenine2503-C2)-methyltransferase
MGKSNIYDLSFSELTILLATWGQPEYRVRQIWLNLYRNQKYFPLEFTQLPVALRQRLFESFEFNPLVPSSTLQSTDGETVKTLFLLHDGNAIESVLMKYDLSSVLQKFENDSPIRSRRTLCISTQVGCAMGCVFCATGQMGFKRNLSSGEIVAQVMYYSRWLKEKDEVLTNVVLMGMGEPFHNYDNTMTAIGRLNDPNGYNFGGRRFTISTVGLVPAIHRFTFENIQVNLAISLHAADDEIRNTMIPVNKRYPIDELLEACRFYFVTTGRRVTFEWALVYGVNDTPEQAHLLANKLKGFLCHVNAIPLNPTAGYSNKATNRKRARIFQEILSNSGIPCTLRLKRGTDIQAGCGQLRNSSQLSVV